MAAKTLLLADDNSKTQPSSSTRWSKFPGFPLIEAVNVYELTTVAVVATLNRVSESTSLLTIHFPHTNRKASVTSPDDALLPGRIPKESYFTGLAVKDNTHEKGEDKTKAEVKGIIW